MNNQNDNIFGNPRFFIVLIVTFLTLVGWQYYMSKTYPPAAQTVKTQNAETTPVANSTQTAPTTATATVEAGNSQDNLAANPSTTKEEKLFNYEDDNVSFKVSSKGLAIQQFTLKKYTNRDKTNVVFNENQAAILVNNQLLDFDLSETAKGEYVAKTQFNNHELTIKLTYNKELGYFENQVSGITGIESITYNLVQPHHIPQSTSFFLPSFEQQDFIHIESGSTKDDNISRLKKGESFNKSSAAVNLAAVGTQYFALAFVNKSDILPSLVNKVESDMAHVTLSYNLKGSSLDSIKNILFLGPKKSADLAKIDSQLPEIMNYGIFGFISKILMKILILIHGLLGNWGLAIIVLTLIVRSILLPFNVMSFRSAQAMQKIKPKMDAIKEKYKNDPVKMNRETMNIMKENNANPLSGCLPMLIQIPIFFALWRAIGSSIEIYQQPFFGWITDLSFHDPFYVIPVLMGITMFLQQKLTPTTMDPMQAKILNFMPIIFTLFMLNLPSGLTIYNFVSALFGVIQQYILLKEKNKTKTVMA